MSNVRAGSQSIPSNSVWALQSIFSSVLPIPATLPVLKSEFPGFFFCCISSNFISSFKEVLLLLSPKVYLYHSCYLAMWRVAEDYWLWRCLIRRCYSLVHLVILMLIIIIIIINFFLCHQNDWGLHSEDYSTYWEVGCNLSSALYKEGSMTNTMLQLSSSNLS